MHEIFMKAEEFINSAGIPKDAIRTVLLLLIGNRFFSIRRRSIRLIPGIAFGICGAFLLLQYGPFRELTNFAIRYLNEILMMAGINFVMPYI